MRLNFKFIAEDQYGNVFWLRTHPRKELLEKLGMRDAEKIYLDDKDGNSHHVGYQIGGGTFYVYQVSPMTV